MLIGRGRKISFLSLSWLVPCKSVKNRLRRKKNEQKMISIYIMLMQGAPRREQLRVALNLPSRGSSTRGEESLREVPG